MLLEACFPYHGSLLRGGHCGVLSSCEVQIDIEQKQKMGNMLDKPSKELIDPAEGSDNGNTFVKYRSFELHGANET